MSGIGFRPNGGHSPSSSAARTREWRRNRLRPGSRRPLRRANGRPCRRPQRARLLEFGVRSSGASIVVLGHDSCSAVAAAIHTVESGEMPGGYIRDIVERVTERPDGPEEHAEPTVEQVEARACPGDLRPHRRPVRIIHDGDRPWPTRHRRCRIQARRGARRRLIHVIGDIGVSPPPRAPEDRPESSGFQVDRRRLEVVSGCPWRYPHDLDVQRGRTGARPIASPTPEARPLGGCGSPTSSVRPNPVMSCAPSALSRRPGGLGQALEPDCRAPESKCPGGPDRTRHPAPARGFGPRVAPPARDPHCVARRPGGARRAGALRLAVPPATAQASPHAPWWDQSQPGELAATFAGFVANPASRSPRTCGGEVAMPGSVAAQLLDALTRQAVAVCDAGLSRRRSMPMTPSPASPPGQPFRLRRGRWRSPTSAGAPRPGDVSGRGLRGIRHSPAVDRPGSRPSARGDAGTADRPRPRPHDRDAGRGRLVGAVLGLGWWDHASWAIAEQEWRRCLVVRNVAALLAHGRVVGH